MRLFLLIVAAWVSALLLTGLVRRWALTIGLLDIPNQRSSHRQVTPRGGGLAIVITVIAGAIFLAVEAELPARIALAWIIGGGSIALVGFWDDKRHLSARARFATHLAAAILGVWAAGGSPPLYLPQTIISMGIVGAALSVVAMVWSINLFNFMDGIDGLAVVQAIFVSLAAALITLHGDPSVAESRMAFIVAAASAGFLVWNFPPARIFMGDVGSGFLGYGIGLCALTMSQGAPMTLWTWIVLHGLFLSDATVTLLVRLVRGETLYQAHRQHAYQLLSRYWNSHSRVLFAFSAINACWLLPIAIATVRYPTYGAILALAALLPLFAGAVLIGAGRDEARPAT